MTGQQEPLNDR